MKLFVIAVYNKILNENIVYEVICANNELVIQTLYEDYNVKQEEHLIFSYPLCMEHESVERVLSPMKLIATVTGKLIYSGKLPKRERIENDNF
jgi:hypothetical protein